MASTEHTERGRWGGQLTRRELPEHDPSLQALTDAERQRLAVIWLHRAAMERRVADSFEVVAAALARRGAGRELRALAERAIDDEYRHAELSRVVASRFAGRELPAPERLSLTVPKHDGASAELRDTLFIVGQCLLNETTASTFLETCLLHAEGALAKTALRELLSDEIDHGRIGWAHLASLDPSFRARLLPWLLPMAFVNLRQWRHESPADRSHTPGLTRHGAPPASIIHEALVDALRTLILPGLADLGLQSEGLSAWVKRGAQTERAPRELAV